MQSSEKERYVRRKTRLFLRQQEYYQKCRQVGLLTVFFVIIPRHGAGDGERQLEAMMGAGLHGD